MNTFRVFIILICLALVAAGAIFYVHKRYALPVNQNFSVVHTAKQVSASTPNSPVASSSPTILLLKVPFTPQAPTANWDTIHNEDCEEASSIMANAYYNGPQVSKLDPGLVENQLTQLTTWEMQNFGYNLDVTSEETVKMIEANYNLSAKVVYEYFEQDIKNELLQNHLVLIPENGQLLGNPNYKQPGPKYHMLVIRGFTHDSLITNDSGTRNGLNYSYSFDTLFNANGEWNHQTNSVDLNKKNIIIVSK